MVGVDPEMGGSLLRTWLAGGAAALLAAAFALMFFRERSGSSGTFARFGLLVVGALLGAVVTWIMLDRGILGDREADRRALQMRAEELAAQTLQPGSPLACLSALAGDAVEAACEKALFASPASVAAATSYAAAQFALMVDMVRYVRRGGTGIETVLLPLRRSLEADRFGFVAHALAMRDGCTSQNCQALTMLVNASRIRANLAASTLDHYLDRYASAWAQISPNVPVAAAAAQSAAALAVAAPEAAAPAEPPPHKIVNIDFPSAASIPPVSIMNPEPLGKTASGTAAPGTTSSVRRSPPQHKQTEAAGSVQSPGSASAPHVDPVWTPAPAGVLPQATATPGASAANFASGVMTPAPSNSPAPSQ